MSDTQVRTAADLCEPEIRHQSPLYGLTLPGSLFERLKVKSDQLAKRNLRFPPSHETKLLEPETGAEWEPLSLGAGADHWFYGQVTLNPEHVGDYIGSYSIHEEAERLFPEIFVWNFPVVSERVRDLINDMAPDFCYFLPAKVKLEESGEQLQQPYFHVYVRRSFAYKGPHIAPGIRPEGERYELVINDTWTPFCNSQLVQEAAFDLPIFLFNRQHENPIVGAELFRLLKRENVTGLLEMTSYRYGKKARPYEYEGYETVFPLDPSYRQ